VQVGSQISGRIQELYGDFNSIVSKGQTLAIIDPAQFNAQCQKAEAGLATAQAAVRNAEAELVNRQAEITSAKANLEVARVDQRESERQLVRAEELFQDKLIPKKELENAQAACDQSKAKLIQAQAQISKAEASILSAHAQREQALAQVQQAQAELQMVEVDLQYTTITSPIDGLVIERAVDVGQTVAASLQSPTLFVVAQDLSKMQVVAQIDEADIGMISDSAQVEFTVDAYPTQIFKGDISEIRLAGSTGDQVSNVVVYDVIINVDNPQLKLRPGMTATVTFTVACVEDTLKVANAALRYQPSAIGQGRVRSSGSEGASQTGKGARREMEVAESVVDAGVPNQKGDRESLAAITFSGANQDGVNAGQKVHFVRTEPFDTTWATVWVLDETATPQRRRVKLGITDGRETAVLEGDLQEGERVITAELCETEAQPGVLSPFDNVRGGRRGGR
jgi:HlyD family secretion protein